MNLGKLIVAGGLLVVVGNTTGAQRQFETKMGEVPFARIAENHEIDRRCPATGKSDGNPYHYAQNAAKNNFTAKGIPLALSIRDFTRLQQASQQKIDSSEIVLNGKYPEDRTRLRNLIKVRGRAVGEGTLVSFRAYVFAASYANTKYTRDFPGTTAQGRSR